MNIAVATSTGTDEEQEDEMAETIVIGWLLILTLRAVIVWMRQVEDRWDDCLWKEQEE